MYSIKHLQYLVAVEREQSFSKAAAACFVTQSTLSLGIQELERQMDVQLFERGRKTILPTAAGKIALNHAKQILNKSELMHTEMQQLTNPSAGPLRVGVIPTIAPYFLPQFLPQLEKLFTDSNLQIAEDPTETILRKIHEGKMDLGILALPVDIGDLDHVVLLEEDFVLAAPKTSKMPRTITLDNLSDQDLLLLRDGHCLKDHILESCKLPPEQQNQFFEAESLNTLLAMVNQGYGMTLLPQMAVKSHITKPFPHVVTKPFKSPAPTRHIGLVWRKTDIRANVFRGIKL